MSRKPPLIFKKTTLHPDDAVIVKELQLALTEARIEINKTRPDDAERESTLMMDMMTGIGFVDVRKPDGSPISIRFVAGVKHPDTGLDQYIVTSREAARAWEASPYRMYHWRATAKGVISTMRSADTCPASRRLFLLLSPDVADNGRTQVSIKTDADGNRNALDLRPENLEAQKPDGTWSSTAPDQTPFVARIDAALASIRRGTNNEGSSVADA